MSLLSCNGWHNLLYNIQCDLMIMVGLNSLHDLQKCRQVCHIWKRIISQMPQRKKDTIRRLWETLTAQIREEWNVYDPYLPEVLTASRLAHHGLLRDIKQVFLAEVDLASVPDEHLAALASCATESVAFLKARRYIKERLYQKMAKPNHYLYNI